MQGSLALQRGVLWIGRHEKTAHVRPYDLDGRALGAGFSFRGPHGEPAAAGGLDVDEDRKVWVADPALGRVHAFTAFGARTGEVGAAPVPGRDAPGSMQGAVDVRTLERDEERVLLVACEGVRRHAVQLVQGDGTWIASLRSEGSPLKEFHDVHRLAVHGELTYVVERGAGRIQVFRNDEFHFLFHLPAAPGQRFEPTALAPLSDGRLVVATGGEASALLLVDPNGRLLRVLAEGGTGAGRVHEPNDLAVEEEGPEKHGRLVAIDRDAERVQVFTLDGACYGSFESLPGERLG